MKVFFFFVMGAVILPLLTLTLLGADKDQKLKRGVSADAAAKLLKAAQTNHKEHMKQEAQKAESLNKRIDAALQKERKALETALNKLPEYATYKRELAALQGKTHSTTDKGKNPPAKGKGKTPSQTDSQAMAKAMKDLFDKHGKLWTRALSDARIDKNKVADALSKAIGPRAKVKHVGPLLTFIVSYDSKDAPGQGSTPPPNAPPTQTSFTMTPGFGQQVTGSNGVLDVNNFSARRATGDFDLKASVAVLSHAGNGALLGDYLTVPTGFTKMKITARVQMRYELSISALLGGGHSEFGMRFQLSNTIRTWDIEDVPVDQLSAAVVGNYVTNGDGEQHRTKTFTIPNTGGEYLVIAGGYTKVDCAAGCTSASTVSGTVNSISVEVLP